MTNFNNRLKIFNCHNLSCRVTRVNKNYGSWTLASWFRCL